VLIGNLQGPGVPGARLAPLGSARVSFYWRLPNYIPVPDGWTVQLDQLDDSSEMLETKEQASTQAELARDHMICEVTYHQP
jgi:hypothetical protein